MDTLFLTQKGTIGKDFTLKEGYKYNGFDPETGTHTSTFKDIPLNETRIGDKVFRNGSVYLSYNPMIESVKVQFSATKLLYGSSLFEYDKKDGNKLLEKLYDVTKEHINIDFENMNASRYDDSVNIPTIEETPNYLYAVGESVMQKEGTFDKKEYEGETVRLSNSSLSIECYDKVKKESMVEGNNYDPYAPMFKGMNYFRLEMQNKLSQGIRAKSRYGRKLSFKEILSDEVQETSKRIMVETFEKYFLPKGITKHETGMRAIEMIKESEVQKRNILNEFYMYQAMKSSTPDEVKRIMKFLNMSPQWISKQVKKLRQYQAVSFENETLIQELYLSLKNKVA